VFGLSKAAGGGVVQAEFFLVFLSVFGVMLFPIGSLVSRQLSLAQFVSVRLLAG